MTIPTPQRLDEIATALQGYANELRSTATPTSTTTPPAPTSTDTKQGMTLALVEQFDGRSGVSWRRGKPSDAAGGHHGYLWDDNNKELGFYLAQNVAIEGDRLVLTANKKRLQVVANKSQQGHFVSASSSATSALDTYYSGWESGYFDYQTGTATTGPDLNGMIGGLTTGDWTPKPASFQFLYGYVEAKIKLPKGKGLWPAFWLLRSDGVWPPEIDILECVDPQAKRIAQHYHYGAINNDFTKNDNLGYDVGVDLSNDFHTYAVDWQPTYIRWYIDGKLTQEFTDKSNIANKPMYILLNLAIGGNWAGAPDASTVFPARMEVDYVKVWQQ